MEIVQIESQEHIINFETSIHTQTAFDYINLLKVKNKMEILTSYISCRQINGICIPLPIQTTYLRSYAVERTKFFPCQM